MATQYTPILQLALPVTGELNGTWGEVVNDNITSMVEEAIAGLANITTWTANSHTLTTADGTTDEARCAMLVAQTGAGGTALTGAGNIVCPDRTKLYVVKNASSYAVTLKTAAGTGVAVAAGDTAFLFCDGTNVEACVTQIVNGHITGNLTVDGNTTVNGNTTLGNSTSDTITATGTVTSNLIFTDNTYDIGASGATRPRNLFLSGNATVGGNTTLGDATSDTVTVTARVASDLNPSADNTYDLGTVGNSWRNLYIDGTATIATLNVTTIDTTNLEVTNIKAKDGTAAITLADSTGVATLSSNPILSAGTANGVTYLNGSKVLTSGSALTFDGDNLTFNGTAAPRFLANMSGTQSTRLAFQNSTTNGNSRIYIYPNGTGNVSALTGHNSSSDLTNYSFFDLAIIGSTDVRLSSARAGTGTYLPLTFYTDGSEQMRLTSTGLGIGTSSPSYKLHSYSSAYSIAAVFQTEQTGSYITFKDATTASVTSCRIGVIGEDIVFLNNGAGTKMRLDSSGNLGLGVTPSSWFSVFKAIQVGGASGTSSITGQTNVPALGLWANAYNDSGNTPRYITSGNYATKYLIDGYTGQHQWFTAPSGTAGDAITFTQAMTLDASGRLGIGVASPSQALDVYGSVNISQNGASFNWSASGNTCAVNATSGAMVFYTGTSGYSERMRIDSSGNVGIGTSSPVRKLHVSGGSAQIDYDYASSGTSFRILNDATPSNGVTLNAEYYGSGSYGPMKFWTGNAERMRIDSSGNVGIGTSSINAGWNLQLGTTSATLGIGGAPTANGTGRLKFVNSSTLKNWQISFNDNVGGALEFTQSTAAGGSTFSNPSMLIDSSGNVGIGTSSPGGRLHVVGTQDQIRAGNGTNTVFFGANNSLGYVGTLSNDPFLIYTNATEKMRIDSSGNLLIGYTSSNGSYKLQVNSQIFATSSTIATSDANYKENVTPLSGALDVVAALNPVQFNWKQHEVHNFDTETPTVGFIAQEVQQVLADAPFINSLVKESEVTLPDGEKEKFLGIAEGNMIAILTKAIQELKAEFDTYKATHP